MMAAGMLMPGRNQKFRTITLHEDDDFYQAYLNRGKKEDTVTGFNKQIKGQGAFASERVPIDAFYPHDRYFGDKN